MPVLRGEGETVSRQLPPPAHPAYPDCSICGQSTILVEDEFVCEDCDCAWNVDKFHLDEGRWCTEEAEQCASEQQPTPAMEPLRCLLNAGHDGEHRAPTPWNWAWTWRDPMPAPTMAELFPGSAP
jgi:hypothetical protein